MSVLSHYTQKNEIDGSPAVPFLNSCVNKNEVCVKVDPVECGHLPIIFIESSIVDKLNYKSIDYKTLFARYCQFYSSTKDIQDFNSIIGVDESIAISVLNKKMNNKSFYSFLTFPLGENDYAREAVKLSERLSKYHSKKEPYIIENNENGFFIIMNENSFVDFDSMYKSLCRDLCERMLQFIDESFVYQSAYFKSL